jgi:hypothetical protein
MKRRTIRGRHRSLRCRTALSPAYRLPFSDHPMENRMNKQSATTKRKFLFLVKLRLSVVVVVVGLSAVSLPPVSYAAGIVLTATEDSTIRDADGTHQGFAFLTSELAPGDVWLSVLKFDLSALAGMTVSSATFELTTFSNHAAGMFVHEVYSSSDDSWAEGTVTGVNRPSDSTLTLLDSTNIGGTSQAYTWNVLAGVVGTDGLAGVGDLLTLLVRPDLSQDDSVTFGPHFNGRTSISGFPRLLVDVEPSVVPIPTAVWLFGSGLIGLLGLTKREGEAKGVKRRNRHKSTWSLFWPSNPQRH